MLLRSKLFVAVLTATCLFAAMAGLALLCGRLLGSGVRDEALASASRTADAVATVALADSQQNDEADPTAVLQGYVRRVDTLEALILRAGDGTPLASAGSAAARRIPDASRSPRIAGNHLVVDVPLNGQIPEASTLTVVLAYSPVKASIDRSTGQIDLALALAALAITLAVLPLVLRAMNTVASQERRRDADVERSMRTALNENRFELHYQPIFRTSDGVLRGVEALVRLRTPDGTLVPPGAFIPDAERTGFIRELGAWVLDAACRQAACWRADGHWIATSVNVSPEQIRTTDMPALVRETLARHQLPAELLWLELTESALHTDIGRARDTLSALAELGVACTLDDFGADWSSLARLRDLPLRGMKIDRAFFTGVPNDDRATRLLDAIVALGTALELHIVAEGIETADQLAYLNRTPCGYAQGFHLGRPTPASEVPLGLAETEQLSPARAMIA